MWLVNFDNVILRAYVNAVISGSTIYQLNWLKDGFTMSRVPKRPKDIAPIRCIPIEFLSIKTEKTVMKTGFMKNKLLASAKGILVKEI